MKVEIKFYYMTDRHTFYQVKQKTLSDVVKKHKQLAKENPCGMICKAIVLKDDVEIFRIGENIHVDNNGNIDDDDLNKWLNYIKINDYVKEYFYKLNNECINFGEYILSDYEIVTDNNDNLLFQLCGTKQKYTSEELYDRFLNYKLNIEY